MKKGFAVMIVFLIGLFASSTQAQSVYRSPLDIPLFLSGNFGEIRSNHFHSGIDIKTQGVTGKRVLSIEKGYVSRIFVSPYGFGLALYITHPMQGTTSVYGHLDRFAPKIAAYVRKLQYAAKEYAIDKYLASSTFPVEKGELIAYSGNSGSSGGPHLHFEIRQSQDQAPINILGENLLQITDNIRPRIVSVTLVEVDTLLGVPRHQTTTKTATKEVSAGNYTLAQSFSITRPSYFAIEVTDRKNGTDNSFGIKKMTITRNNKPYFGFDIRNISFATTRYVNTLMLYPDTKSTRNDIFRTYLSPNNRLSIYTNVSSRGIIRPTSISQSEKIQVEVQDDSNNSASLVFSIQKGDNRPTTSPPAPTTGTAVWWMKGITHTDSICNLSIPPKALYESILLDVSTTPCPQGLSDIIHTSNDNTPLQTPFTLSIKSHRVPTALQQKSVIVKISDNGTRSALTTSYSDGCYIAKSSSFGSFGLDTDTIPPSIRPVSLTGSTLKFKATDNLSGIKSWRGTIDGTWILLHYDPKTNSLTHYLSDGIATKGTRHTLIVEATDAVGNKSSYKHDFTWQ